jgi:hypothetical protein
VEDQLPAARTGIQLLLDAPEVHAALLHGSHGLDELGKGSAKPVKTPHDDERVTVTHIGQRLGEARAVGAAT